MHLLSREDSGGLKLTEFVGRQPPGYAILSHTWLSDAEEVTYKDIKKDRGKSKKGYWKIEFCLRQAQKDGLDYCWVDTCCIDKTNSTELHEAINSMYKWYRNASKCYVYLADISANASSDCEAGTEQKLTVENGSPSRWFSRKCKVQMNCTSQHAVIAGILTGRSRRLDLTGAVGAWQNRILRPRWHPYRRQASFSTPDSQHHSPPTRSSQRTCLVQIQPRRTNVVDRPARDEA